MELAKEYAYLKDKMHNLEDRIISKQKKTHLKFEVHLCDHCNLNCKGCDHFSPLAKEHFLDLDTFKNDMFRLAELFGDKVLRVHLLGGEPLLTPNIIEYLHIARDAFPHNEVTIIDILTNGLLLGKQNELFWQTCKELDIRIRITKYPINFDYDQILSLAHSYGVFCDYYNDVSSGDKGLFKIALRKEGKGDPCENFLNCRIGNRCIMLKNGRLYPCTLIPNIEHFNTYFHETFYEDDCDSIDIYKARTADEILEFLHNPVPFCKYCERDDVEYMEWEQSKKHISEWI